MALIGFEEVSLGSCEYAESIEVKIKSFNTSLQFQRQ